MSGFPEALDDCVHYFDFPGFDKYFLEDSFLIGLIGHEDELELHVQGVLNFNHPHYHQPYEGQAYSYGRTIVRFPNLRSALWQHSHLDKSGQNWLDGMRSLHVYIDLDGSLHYGQIDYLVRDPEGYYLMEGENWRVRIESEVPTVELVSVYPAPASPIPRTTKSSRKSDSR